jgi:L-2-hydroxyglutarate oxidase LhgO
LQNHRMIDEVIDITVIGAGLIGLAVARELSGKHKTKSLVVLEKNDSYGQETSSRAGEIVHSGLYFPAGFFKGDFCRPGNTALFEICAKHNIPHRQMGKLIVATGADQIERLEKIKAEGEKNGVDDLTLLSQRQVHSLEPDVRADAALFSPSTGVLDCHQLMHYLLKAAEFNGADVVYRSKATGIEYDGKRYTVDVNGGEYRFRTNLLINSAGLYADRIAELAGMDIDAGDYRIYYNKGTYYSASPSPKLAHMVWPVRASKGKQKREQMIHSNVDLGGSVKFGPRWEYVDKIEYTVNESQKDFFYESIRTYLPKITKESLSPSMSGVRPRIQGPNDPYRDFIIKDEADTGFPGFINLIGIECPGLTDSIPLARYVASLVEAYL